MEAKWIRQDLPSVLSIHGDQPHLPKQELILEAKEVRAAFNVALCCVNLKISQIITISSTSMSVATQLHQRRSRFRQRCKRSPALPRRENYC